MNNIRGWWVVFALDSAQYKNISYHNEIMVKKRREDTKGVIRKSSCQYHLSSSGLLGKKR